jgi:hypothetical protein
MPPRALKLTAAGEDAVLALVRAARNAGGYLGRLGDAAFSVLRPAPPPPSHALLQRVFWGVDADGIPVRPWRLKGDDYIECVALGCDVPARVCVARQKASDAQRTKDTWRGEASEYPSCVTERCAQGRGVREALEPGEDLPWRGAGPGKRFVSRRKTDCGPQQAARKRLQRSGMLDRERLLDVDPDPVRPKGED